jgi:1-deoxy-D-xylulose-5-phosphate synthase
MSPSPALPSLSDIRAASPEELQEYATSLRAYLTLSLPGKIPHLESSLGVLELTLVLHRLLETPRDILIWDVGHQCYVHKLLTPREARFDELRKLGGPSGFPNRSESPFDPYGTGHSGTALSALIGMAMAAKQLGEQKQFAAVVGDGALTSGQVMEALNHAGSLGLDLTLVLNDNGLSIDPTAGALNEFGNYRALFEAFHWAYHGPIDGHSLGELEATIGKSLGSSGPQVVHIKTIRPVLSPPHKAPTDFTSVFADYASEQLRVDPRFVLISPAMLGAGGMNALAEAFPDRVVDPAIAEQHALGLAAGLAVAGMRPFVHIYSTFAQRAFDQILSDVALQSLGVRLLIDRAGITGEDGPTHHGAFDLGMLRLVPGLEVWDATDGACLSAILRETENQKGPVAIRIPRGSVSKTGSGSALPAFFTSKDNAIQDRQNSKAWIVLGHAIEWADVPKGHNCLVIQRAKPLPAEELLELSTLSREWTVVEDASVVAGLGEALAAFAQQHRLDVEIEVRAIPDRFIPHGKPEELRKALEMERGL